MAVDISLNYDVTDNKYGGGLFKARVSFVTFRLIWKLIERDRLGKAKYGTSLDRTDLTREQWLDHMTEELLDAAGYAQSAKR